MKSCFFKGNITILNLDFFDSAFTFSNESIQVPCCARDTTLTNVTCGQGTSCIGQCSAIEASLCPSGNCTHDPEDCKPNLELKEAENVGERRKPISSRPSWEFKWCTPRCWVRYHKACCFHPICQKRKQGLCSWMNYFTGGNIVCSLFSLQHFRQLLPPTRQHPPWQLELPNAGNPNS